MPRRRANCRRCAASSPSPPPRPGARPRYPGSGRRKHRAACRGRSRPTRRSHWPRKRPRTPSSPGSRRATLAVLTLLYGSGLRVAEALALTGAALPLGEALVVTGKRNKTRIVPLARAGQGSDRALSGALPLAGGEGRALVPRRARRTLARRDRPPRGRQGAARARPLRADHAARAAPQLRHPFARAAARICRSLQELLGHASLSLDPDLHRGRRGPSDGRLSPRPSAGLFTGWRQDAPIPSPRRNASAAHRPSIRAFADPAIKSPSGSPERPLSPLAGQWTRRLRPLGRRRSQGGRPGGDCRASFLMTPIEWTFTALRLARSSASQFRLSGERSGKSAAGVDSRPQGFAFVLAGAQGMDRR